MGLKRTTVYLDEYVLLLAYHQGVTNLSDFFRKCLESVVLAEDEMDIPDIARQKAVKVASDLKNEMRKQKKIVAQDEVAQTEAREYHTARQQAIEDACLKVFLKYRDFSRCLPENDVEFEYIDKFDQAVKEVCQLAGHDVDTTEVIAVYHKQTGTQPVNTRIVNETVYGVKLS